DTLPQVSPLSILCHLNPYTSTSLIPALEAMIASLILLLEMILSSFLRQNLNSANLRILHLIPTYSDLVAMRQQQAIALSTIKLRGTYSLIKMDWVVQHKFK
ncbi:hypothetical protein, partial [uncultured Nostoc sp.]